MHELQVAYRTASQKQERNLKGLWHPCSAVVVHSPPERRTDLLRAMKNMLRSHGNYMSPMQGIQTRKTDVENCCKQQASLLSSYVVLRGITLQTML